MDPDPGGGSRDLEEVLSPLYQEEALNPLYLEEGPSPLCLEEALSSHPRKSQSLGPRAGGDFR